MKKILFLFLFLIIFFQFAAGKIYALTGAFGQYTDIIFCNTNPTTWQVNAFYHDFPSNVNIVLGSSFSINQGTGFSKCPGNYRSFEFANQRPESGDYVHWFTACVDPTVNIRVNNGSYIGPGGLFFYETDIPAQCKSIGAGGTANKVYAGCYHLNYTSVNYGTVSSGAQCPYYDTSSSYCTKAGITAYSALCGASGCGGTNNCTYYNKTCSGTSCSHPGTTYSNSCGGSNISGTNMCGNYSATCAPPGPNVTSTASCSGGKARISSTWTTPALSNGNYDLRWKVSGAASFTNVCSPSRPYVISGLADNTSYQVEVRSHTLGGYNGPTNFGSDTVTTPTCAGPPPPTCTLTATPNSIPEGGTSALAANCTPGAGGGSVTYSWPAPSIGSVGNVTTASNTYTAPSSVVSTTTAIVHVTGCNTIGGACKTVNTNVIVNKTPTYTIAGNVFVDTNSDGYDVSESNYSGAITITSSGGGVVTYPSTGNYLISNLPAGQYTISYTNKPAGYKVTYPQSAGTPSFLVTVGLACTTNANKNAVCDPSGNITALDFGITNAIPWIQSTGGDITGTNFSTNNGGFSDQIPSAASCQSYASVVPAGASTPGIIYSGSTNPSFGLGAASINNWSVGTTQYPEVYTPPIPNTIKTSYNYITNLVQSSGASITDICTSGGNCTLTFAPGSHGVFRIPSSITLTGTGGTPDSYTFPAKTVAGSGQYVILVNGDLNIKTQIHVPVGDSVLFTSSGNINVDPSVGEANPALTNWDLEGYYSADKNFTVVGTNTCPAADNRLNVAGAIVANASLQNYSFSYTRDLCAADLQCPVFSITERPDFILNSTDFLKSTRRVWQEVAP